ncbi:MAG: DUF2200 domain-containing protein [Rhodobacteraceae bacterium]|nr:DUF2200 domain-containing protein [Paracoccaceae bacterium]MBR9819522.1 DUF2200 domain-containing protein [Paracoccaceae bacterium]
MAEHRIYSMAFDKVYQALLQKLERKGRTKAEVDAVIHWLTGYDQAGLQTQLDQAADVRSFFEDAPELTPDRRKITGVVCGVRVEEIEDPLMQDIRYLDKLVDELARGKAMEKVLRQ